MNFKVRAEEIRKVRKLEKNRKEQAETKIRPQMSKGSRKILMQSGLNSPLYTNERLHQITARKRRNLEKLKLNLTYKVKNTFKPPEFQAKKNNLHFNSKHVRSQIFKKTNIVYGESTEEIELNNTCTFRPKINEKSNMICLRQSNKTVVERLMAYGESHKRLKEKLIKESLPKFIPNINKYSAT